MSSLAVLTIVGVLAVAVLTWFFIRTRSADLLEEIVSKRRPSAKLATRAELVEGMNHIPVALSLTDSALHYENVDMQAELELDRIEEVEYDNELAIGKGVDHGRVMRLRSHGHAVEFIIEPSNEAQWTSKLPARRMGSAAAV